NGHGPHDTVALIKLARKSHKLRPLDVGVFRPFQSAWLTAGHEVVEDTAEEIPRRDFICEYMAIRAKTFKLSTIKSALKSSGAWPINPMFSQT
ncbi:hypothetical protein B0H14DRAFT_2341730, partial [Mycena olivaceomarginata]